MGSSIDPRYYGPGARAYDQTLARSDQAWQNFMQGLYGVKSAAFDDGLDMFKQTGQNPLMESSGLRHSQGFPGGPGAMQAGAPGGLASSPGGLPADYLSTGVAWPGTETRTGPSKRQIRESQMAAQLNHVPNDELVARAEILGIRDAAQIPRSLLQEAIVQQRIIQRPTATHELSDAALDAAAWEIPVQAAKALAGLGRQLASSIPIIGDDIDHALGAHTTEMWMNRVDEGIRLNIPNYDQSSASLMSGVGTFVGYAVAAEVAYKNATTLLYKAGGNFPAIGRIAGSAMARGAVLGASTSLLLEAGSDHPWLPSLDDFQKMFAGDSELVERAGAGLRLAFGNRLMNAALGGLMGGYGERIAESLNLKAYHRRLDEQQLYDKAMQSYQGQVSGGAPMGQLGPGGGPQAMGPGQYNMGGVPEEYVFTVDAQGNVVPETKGGGPQGPAIPMPAQTPMQQHPMLRSGVSDEQWIQGGPVGQAASWMTPEGTPTSNRLQGPWRGEVQQQRIGYADRAVNELNGQISEAQARFDAGDLNAGLDLNSLHTAKRRILAEQAQMLTSSTARYTSTRADAAPIIQRLQVELEAKMNSGLASDDEIEALHSQISDWVDAAGIPKRQLPTTWEVLRDNPRSPATPSAQIVKQHGTTVVTPNGEPKLMFHGSSQVYDAPDPVRLAAGGDDLLVGPGWYWTENPVVAGGDPAGMVSQPGYSEMRAAYDAGNRRSQQNMVTRFKQSIDLFEAHGPSAGITPDVYAQMKQELPQLEETLMQMPVPAPNVRAAFLAVKNPFQYDQPLEMEAGMQIIRAASEKHPEFDWTSTANAWSSQFRQKDYPYTNGQFLYNLINDTRTTGEMVDSGAFRAEVLGSGLGKSRTNQLLQDMGYDAIQYEGGLRMGSGSGMGSHASFNVFDPAKVVPAYLDESNAAQAGRSLGVQMAKAEALHNTPAMAEISQAAVVEDINVAQAMHASTPGGLYTLKGVQNPEKLMASLAEQMFAGAADPSQAAIRSFRPIMNPRTQQMDVLVSSFEPITDEMAAQYTATGFFDGMDAVKTKTGQAAKVLKVGAGKIYVQTPAQARRGPNFGNWVDPSTLSPQNSSARVLEAPELYQEFKGYALAKTQARVQTTAPGYVVDWMDDPQLYQRLGGMAESFMDAKGITDPNVRGAVYRYFDQQRINEFADPSIFEVTVAHAAEEAASARMVNEVPDLFELGNSKGYRVVPNERVPGFQVMDTTSDQKHLFDDEESAREFLNEIQPGRLPDHTPSSVVPMEAVPVKAQNSAHKVPDEDTISDQAVEDMLDWEDSFSAEVVDEEVLGPASSFGSSSSAPGGAAFAGGGAGTPPPPIRPPVASSGHGGPPPGGPGGIPKAARRASLKAQLTGPGLVQALHNFQRRVMLNYVSPMRNSFADLEQLLHNNGAVDVKPWQLFDDVIAGQDVGHNVAWEFHTDIQKQLARISPFKKRSGDWYRTWEIKDLVARVADAKSKGMTKNEIGALGQIDNVLSRMHGGGNHGEQLKEYIAKVRTAQTSSTSPFDIRHYDQPGFNDIAFFTQFAKDTRMRFETVDPASLLRSYVTSYHFSKYAGPAWNEARDTFRMIKSIGQGDATTPRSEELMKLGDYMMEWLDYARRGPEPGKDIVVKGLRSILSPIVPLTHHETKNLLQAVTGGMYNATQGWRIHVIARDLSQPWLAVPTVGPGHIARAYKTAASLGSRARAEMWERAYDLGITQKEIPRYEGAGIFEPQGAQDQIQFNAWQRGLRTVGAGIADAAQSVVPSSVRGMNWNWARPLHFYTKEGELNRVIVGEAAYQRFGEALAAHQAAPNVNLLMKSTNSDSFRPAISRRIEQLVSAGSFDEAQATYARAVANRTQFTYGTRHSPAGLRTTAGRMGYAFGNFTSQFAALNHEGLRWGNWKHKIAFVSAIAAHEWLTEEMDAKTGWNFRQYSWWPSMGFVGSPFVRDVASAYQGVSNVRDAAFGNQDQSFYANQALDKVDGGKVMDQMARTFNPLQGAAYNAQGLAGISESPAPGMAALQFGLTGNTRGAASQFQQMTNEIPTTPITPQASREVAPQRRLPGASQFHGPTVFQQMHQLQQREPAPAETAVTSFSPGFGGYRKPPQGPPRAGGGFF